MVQRDTSCPLSLCFPAFNFFQFDKTFFPFDGKDIIPCPSARGLQNWTFISIKKNPRKMILVIY